MNYFELIEEACKNLKIELNEKKYNQFIKYMELIIEWNKKINLTAITDEDEIIKKHFIDSIKVLEFKPVIGSKNLIDIGTGAGLPGIPIKIMLPELEVTLLDSLNKRILFLDEVIKELQLNGIKAVHGRAEEMAHKKEYRENYDIAISRAVANLSVLSEYCIPYVKENGYFIAMKGPALEEEMNESGNAIPLLGGKVEKVEKVFIEKADLNHNILLVKKVKRTNDIYPRKQSSINKKPLK